jgi:CheY-like chemotaxis protein
MLEKYGFTVKEALSPHEGLELVISEDPMLVLLDLNMPNVSGEALLHLINNMEKTKETKVVILSAQITKENIKSTYLNGAVGFIAKPFEEKVLIEKINEVLDKESLRKLKKDPKIKEEFFLKI